MNQDLPPAQPISSDDEEDLEASLTKLATRLFPREEVERSMREMEARAAAENSDVSLVAELQARLTLSEEARLLAQKEREAAEEARKKLEKTLGDLLSRFAALREEANSASQSRTELEALRTSLQHKDTELAGRLEALEAEKSEITTKLEYTIRERDELAGQIDSTAQERDAAIEKYRSEHAALLSTRDESLGLRDKLTAELQPMAAEHGKGVTEITSNVEDLLEQLHAARDEMHMRFEQLENVASYLTVQLGSLNRNFAQRVQNLGTGSSQKLPRPASSANLQKHPTPPQGSTPTAPGSGPHPSVTDSAAMAPIGAA